MANGKVKLHGPEAFEGMRAAGRLAAEVLDMITPHVVPGVTTGELDRLCDEYIRDHNSISACLNYRGFPKSICTSINHVVCHGIPGDKKLQNGDIMKRFGAGLTRLSQVRRLAISATRSSPMPKVSGSLLCVISVVTGLVRCFMMRRISCITARRAKGLFWNRA